MKYGIVGSRGRMGTEIARVFDAAGHVRVLTSEVEGVECRERPEVLVDFSSHAALQGTAALCRKHRCGLVVGTTALRDEHFALLRELGTEVPVVQSFNFATGVNLLALILKDYAPFLSDWDLEITETHHNRKKDAPSGTAILLREAVGRDCPTHSLRLGGVPGDHSAHFGNDGEVLTFTHRALNRSVFALGALRAAGFARTARPGFHSFRDVLRNCREERA